MTNNDDRSPNPLDEAPSAAPTEPRIAFERLRERTDELELIISGLTVFALFALPQFLLDTWIRLQVHVDGDLFDGLNNIFMFACGLSYTLGLAFVSHLGVRAYWVGLIGLKSVFPRGVRWDATPTLGPIGRNYFKRRLPDIDAAIDRADRIASIIFALASLVAILVAWIGMIIGLMIGLLALVRTQFDLTDRSANIILLGSVSLLLAMTLFNWLADTRIIKGESGIAAHPHLHRWVDWSVRITNAIIPQRLILPVQLTLQSNLPPRRFTVGFAIAIALVPIIGGASVRTRALFAPINSYVYFDNDAAERSMRSAYYESLRSADDSGLHLPTIPSDRVADSYLRVFLPYLPSRDNAVLRQRCADTADSTAVDTTDVAGEGTSEARETMAANARLSGCLAAPWRIRIDDRDYPVADFMPAERRDLGARGLQGYLPLAGFAPGRHDLVVTWNDAGPAEGSSRRRDYHIPFWFAPTYEMGIDTSPP